MASNNGYEKYKKVDVSTASQNRLIIMLYDGAIKFLETACAAMDKKHGTEEAHNNILKAQEIIYELLSSLNYEAGDIANRLASIYTYMNQKLTEGNISKTKPPLLEVIRYLKELKMAWEGVEEQIAKGNTENKSSSTKKDEGESKLNITG
ncbi:flagellar export chaperone FliS [Brachyspira murdochii]|uniref:Flagellar secretion chaperone FliS n=2 Tax=Brachyspira murdochii TaxID=84378 RepID=D5U691_BRAM5|nr:flagellar export chaperone FliS [Brachyspira murdochii]ADG72590.1 flagellar protein FliS [Brachyspira murdochii DSM 12563]PPS22065.1 flagellar biosynthesis protein FliS [Brachyspira murdochii]